MTIKYAVIIVAYNSGKVLDKAIECVRKQARLPERIVIVDTGSKDTAYLDKYEKSDDAAVIFDPAEGGFCGGNNIGYKHLSDDTDYVLLLNPDVFLLPGFIEGAIHFMERDENRACGMVSGTVLGYDIEKDQPSGRYDTTGIFKRWYGHWYDRGKGELCDERLYTETEKVPAICGALMFCRKNALDEALIRGNELFDSNFFMYKEDIDLSLRLRKKGWNLIYVPELKAYHCRGWHADRKKMPRKARLLSAKNEIKVQAKTLSPLGILYSMIKYASVIVLDL